MSTVRKVCLIVVFIFITSVASNLVDKDTKRNELLSQRVKRSDQSVNYRLPNNSLPISYDLWILTDIHKGYLKFNGRVKIQIKIIEESETITMHSRDIIIDKVDLYDKTGNLSLSSLQFDNSTQQDFLVISLQSFLNVSDEIMLDIEYHGNMTNNEMSGLYATSYQDEENEKVWLASTHFLSTSARKAFPCYDEPQIRVPIQLRIQHGKSFRALSNMPMLKIDAQGTSYVTTTFVETPPIPTYLLAFVVSNLDFISNENEQFEQSIYGEPMKIRNGTAMFALKTVDEVLNKFIEVFPSIPLGITKIDHVEIPLFNGGLEHYGLIIYEESSLLLNDKDFTDEVLEYFKPQIIGVIAHCIAHQYFGSIVSNNWWQYLWLNEGISIFFQYHISNLLYPEYDYMNLFQDLIVQPLFKFDVGLNNTLNDYVESPAEIDQKFNSFIVEKSAVIIRMFYEALSPSTFTKGLTVFLNEMRFKAANSLDLHKALQKAFDDDNPDNNLNISKLMSTWEEQPGYPIISVKKSGNDVILTQKRFPDEKVNDFYAIPLTFATKTNPNFNETTAKVWMTSVVKINGILNNSDEWIIFNNQLVGFYRVDYSRELWDVIIKGYKTNFEIIHHVNRKELHEEMFLGWKILKTKTASDCLEFMNVLEHETSGNIWKSASYYLEQLHKFLLFSDVYEDFQTKMHKILLPHLKVLKASKAVDRDFPVEIKRWSIISQHPEFLEQQLNQLLIYMATNSTSDKPDLCSALSIANETIYRHYIDEVINFQYFLDLEVVGGLGCSFNRTLLNELFSTFLNPINGVEPYFVTNVIEVAVGNSVVGLETVMDLISDKWWEISQLQPEYINTIVSKTHEIINSPKHLERFKSLANKLIQNRAILPELIASQLKTIQEKLEDEEWKNIKEWFGVEEEQTSSSTITSTSPPEDTTLDAVSLSTPIRIIAICISLCFLLKQKFT